MADVEKNVGVSRQYSIFELTKCLSYRESAKALQIAARIGETPRFALPAAVAPLFNHFYRILKYHAGETPKVNPYFLKEYDAAARNYSLAQCRSVVSLLCEYDYKGKGGDAGEASQGELLVELITKIIAIR